MVLKRLEPPSSSKFPAGTRTGRARILYVEDDDAVWRVTERFLRERYDISRATTSDQALFLLGSSQFDFILLDIELAGSALDGIELCQVLRGRVTPPLGTQIPAYVATIPIVFVTAFSGRYPREELLSAGANEVVTKPVDYTRLLLVSSRLLVRGIRGSTST